MNDTIQTKQERDEGHILRLEFGISCLEELKKDIKEEVRKLIEGE